MDHIDAIRADLEKERMKLLEDLSNETRIGRIKQYCKRGHRLAGENLHIKIRNGHEHSYCLACRRILDRERYLRRKEQLEDPKKHSVSEPAQDLRGRGLQAGTTRIRKGMPTKVQGQIRRRRKRRRA